MFLSACIVVCKGKVLGSYLTKYADLTHSQAGVWLEVGQCHYLVTSCHTLHHIVAAVLATTAYAADASQLMEGGRGGRREEGRREEGRERGKERGREGGKEKKGEGRQHTQ